MTDNEKHKLAVRTKFNELKIAIEEARAFGLTPSLCVRCFFNDSPLYREPSFNEYEYDNQVSPPVNPEVDYQQFGAV